VFVPYLSLTIGATRLDAQSGGYDSETEFSASLGGGLRFAITQQFFINTGLRGYVTFVDSDTDIFCTGEGDLECLLRPRAARSSRARLRSASPSRSKASDQHALDPAGVCTRHVLGEPVSPSTWRAISMTM